MGQDFSIDYTLYSGMVRVKRFKDFYGRSTGDGTSKVVRLTYRLVTAPSEESRESQSKGTTKGQRGLETGESH